MIQSNIGFSGTRIGQTEEQKMEVLKILEQYQGQFHHGDCLGSDKEANDIAVMLKRYQVIIHPPDNKRLRAFCNPPGSLIRMPKSYLQRNRNIVDESDRLIATPGGSYTAGSGTWYTIGYAKGQGKPIKIILPTGTVVVEGKW